MTCQKKMKPMNEWMDEKKLIMLACQKRLKTMMCWMRQKRQMSGILESLENWRSKESENNDMSEENEDIEVLKRVEDMNR